MGLSRRTFLRTASSGAVMTTLAPGFRAGFAVGAQSAPPPRDILVVVFLRFGCDGLAMIPPADDTDYHANRPTLAVPSSGPGAAVPIGVLDGTPLFMHPNLPELKALYDAGELAVVHAAGVPTASRSHFDIQDMMERGLVDKDEPLQGGWLARHLAASELDLPELGAVASAADVQVSLRGYTGAISIPDVSTFNLFGGDFHLNVIEALNAGPGDHAAAARSTVDTIRTIRAKHAELPPVQSKEIEYGDSSFSNSMRSLADLIKMDVGLEVATVDYSGWDHHFNLNAWFPAQARELSRGLAAFWADMMDFRHRLTVVTMTEFGRRLEENANAGTDHGAASFMFVLGGAVNGGRIFGRWPGLRPQDLREGDLMVTTDYRQVLQEILVKRRRETRPKQVFPSLAYEPLGIMRDPLADLDYLPADELTIEKLLFQR